MILCDSGPLIAAAVSTDTQYRRCVDLFTGLRLAGRRLLVPSTVVAEVGYLLEQRVGPRVEAAFLQAVADGRHASARTAWTLAQPGWVRLVTGSRCVTRRLLK